MSSQVDRHSHLFSPTVLSFFLLLWVYYVVHKIPLQTFERLRLSHLIKRGQRSFFNTKTVFLPVTREIFLKTTRHKLTIVDELSINAEFKVEWVGFIHIGKISFTAAQQEALSLKKLENKNWYFFPRFDQFVTWRLKTSKTDVNYTGLLIVIGTTH